MKKRISLSFMKQLKLLPLLIFLCYIAHGCIPTSLRDEQPALISINLIDRNGLNETITNKERLNQYENVNFLGAQPYQKVLRVYQKDSQGSSPAYITTYYENGQPRQYLEAVNNRAYGSYREWYKDGTLKLEVTLIGGIADLTSSAEKSWQFEGCARAWDENGNIQTEITYEKGLLEGDSIYYHPNGRMWKRIPFHKNQANGIAEYYLDNGQLLQTIIFCHGVRHGEAVRYWPSKKIAAQEHFSQGLLISGQYFDREGNLIAEIIEGEGYRASFNKKNVQELQQFQGGVLQGKVKIFDENNRLQRLYHVENGLKNGEEYEYFLLKGLKEARPKMLINWYRGNINGYVKTWYDNGTLESQREIVNNKRNGLATAWYQDGSLMLIEEYDRDLIVKGEYYKKGDKNPISEILNGKGTATIYDGEGRFIRKIHYYNGKPQE
ncbi:Uncharacterized protein NEOC65_000552 [Neochlamydia sp. AcF65]|nr:Uncharacterized protein [Neochlamydia sp. AcF65]